MVGAPQPRIRGRAGVSLTALDATYIELGGDSSVASRLYFEDDGTGVALRDWTCPIAAIDARIVDRVGETGEQRRFLKPAVAQFSRNPTELKVEGEPRAGESGYSLVTLLGVALDFAVSFTTRPFQRLAGAGFLLFALGVAIGVGYLAARILGLIPDNPPVQAVVVLCVLVGIQVVILGALGEFTHRIYRLVQGRPLFEVKREYGASEDADPAS